MTSVRKETVLAYVRKYHPGSVAHLKLIMSNDGIRSKDDDLLDAIRELQADGSITLGASIGATSYVKFLIDLNSSWWIYAITISSLLEALLVINNVQGGVLSVLRLVIGLGLLGFIPGFCTIQILLPRNQLSPLEQILMSIFLSVVISIAVGVSLGAGYRFSGTSNVVILSAYTTATVLVAGYRQYSPVRVKAGKDGSKRPSNIS